MLARPLNQIQADGRQEKTDNILYLKSEIDIILGAICFYCALTQEQSKRLELQQKQSLR